MAKTVRSKTVKKAGRIKKAKVNGQAVLTSEWRTDVSKQVLDFVILPPALAAKYDYRVMRGGGVAQALKQDLKKTKN